MEQTQHEELGGGVRYVTGLGYLDLPPERGDVDVSSQLLFHVRTRPR